MKGYKAFNADMACRGKQYAENTVFEEEEAEICKSGMHFCEEPLQKRRLIVYGVELVILSAAFCGFLWAMGRLIECLPV